MPRIRFGIQEVAKYADTGTISVARDYNQILVGFNVVECQGCQDFIRTGYTIDIDGCDYCKQCVREGNHS